MSLKRKWINSSCSINQNLRSYCANLKYGDIAVTLLVLRPSTVPPTFLQECSYLVEKTTYLKGEFQKDLAPDFTDCLTSVAWIFRKCSRWKLEWIANMPRKLISHYQFDVAKGSSPGDLIFFSNRKGITKHVGVFVTP